MLTFFNFSSPKSNLYLADETGKRFLQYFHYFIFETFFSGKLHLLAVHVICPIGYPNSDYISGSIGFYISCFPRHGFYPRLF